MELTKTVHLPNRIFTINNFYSEEECKKLIKESESTGFKASAPSGGGHGRTGREDPRTSQFLVLQDPNLAEKIYSRVKSYLASDLSGLSFTAYMPFKEDEKKWYPVGVNPRIRIYKYESGQSFPEHIDYKMGRNVVRNGEKYRQQTFLTLLIYLNEKEFEGGETGFWTQHDKTGVKEHCRFLRDFEHKPHQVVIKPETGKVLISDQNILHEGTPVTKGIKYILRTDLIHEKKVGFHPKVKATLTENQLADHSTEWEKIFEASCKNYAD